MEWEMGFSWAVSDRFQALLAVPYLRVNPGKGDLTDGLGDIGVEGKLYFCSHQSTSWL